MDNTGMVAYGEEIHIRYSLTEQEYVRAVRLYVRRSKRALPALGVGAYLLAAGYFCIAVHMAVTGGMLMGAALMLIVTWLKAYYQLPGRQYRKDPDAAGPVEYWCSAEGLRVHTPTIDAMIRWSAFVEFWEDDDLFVLRRTGQIFTTIPKRAFVEPTSVDRFRQLLQQHIVPRAALPSARPTLIGRRLPEPGALPTGSTRSE